jgi:hypothetical protein
MGEIVCINLMYHIRLSEIVMVLVTCTVDPSILEYTFFWTSCAMPFISTVSTITALSMASSGKSGSLRMSKSTFGEVMRAAVTLDYDFN